MHPSNRPKYDWRVKKIRRISTNCSLPLSVAYIDPDGVIQEIHDLQPQDTNDVDSASENIRFALETTQGWFNRHNIGQGVIVRTDRGSLKEAFGQKR